MIDLRETYLPDSLEVDGVEWPIETDFRVWLRWVTDVDEHGVAMPYVFEESAQGGYAMPPGTSWVAAAQGFASARPTTPMQRKGQERVFDLVLDGDYIVGAFQQAYGIDLTEPSCKLHWWRFMALLHSIPGSTRLSEIMGYRGWKKPPKRTNLDDENSDLKREWSLPDEEEDMREVIDMQKRLLGPVVEAERKRQEAKDVRQHG